MTTPAEPSVHERHLATAPRSDARRKSAEGGPRASPAGWHALATAGPMPGRGEPLASPVRESFERSLGTDLSGVRLHTGPEAAASARKHGASAYTLGSRIAFAGGPPDLRRRRDKRLLAHELVHVTQQSAGAAQPAAKASPEVELEREADRGADALLAGNAPPPPTPVAPGTLQRQEAATAAEAQPAGVLINDRLALLVPFKDTWVNYLLTVSEDRRQAVEGSSYVASNLARDIATLLRTSGSRETTEFADGERMRSLLEEDLLTWLDIGALPRTREVLEERRIERERLRIRSALDRYVTDWGLDPATIDWNVELPGLRSARPFEPVTLIDASHLDRYMLALDLLAGEVAGDAPVPGAARPDSELLQAAVGTFALTELDLPPEARRTFSEAYLAEWGAQLTALRFVPEGFDPSEITVGTRAELDAQRERVLTDYLNIYAPGLVESMILDDWTRSALTEEDFLARLDLADYKASLVPRLTDAFLEMARTDDEFRAALRVASIEEARRGVMTTLAFMGLDLERRHRDLLKELYTVPIDEADAFQTGVAADPYGYLTSATALADATRALLAEPGPGNPLLQGAVDLGTAIAAADGLPRSYATVGAWMSLLVALKQVRDLREEHRRQSRALIAERFEIGYDEVARVVKERIERAEEYIDGTWIPMLKEVALDRIQKNTDDMQLWLDDFEHQSDLRSAQFEISILVFEQIITGLKDGSIESVEVEGRWIDASDLDKLETTVEVLRAHVEEVSSPERREEKRHKLETAVAGFEKVKERINDGTYKPHQYGPQVVEEARRRLGIEWFSPDQGPVTYGQALSRSIVAEPNPFVVWAIHSWEFEEQAAEEAWMLVMVFGQTALAVVGLVSGFLELEAAAKLIGLVDITIGIGAAGYNVVEADRLLDLARLDTDLAVRGISVEQAEEALHHAWINFVAIVLLTAGVAAFARTARYFRRGEQAGAELTWVGRLQQTDPLGLQRLVRIVPDLTVLERLLVAVEGDVLRAESLLAYVSSVRELETLLARVGNAELLERMMVATQAGRPAGAYVARLLDRVPNPTALVHLLENTQDAVQLSRFLNRFEDPGVLAGFLDELGAVRLERLTDELTEQELATVIAELDAAAVRQVADRAEGWGLRQGLLAEIADRRLLAALEAEHDPAIMAALERTNAVGVDPAERAVRMRRLLDWARMRPALPGKIEEGAVFGRGGTGSVAEVAGRPDLASKKGTARAGPEARAMVELELADIRTVYVAEGQTTAGEGRLILRRIDGVGSKDIIGRTGRPPDDPVKAAEYSKYVTERTVQDLNDIQAKLENARMNVGDFQFIIRRSDGAVFVNDPVSVTFNSRPSGKLRGIIMRFEAIYRRNVAAGTTP